MYNVTQNHKDIAFLESCQDSWLWTKKHKDVASLQEVPGGPTVHSTPSLFDVHPLHSSPGRAVLLTELGGNPFLRPGQTKNKRVLGLQWVWIQIDRPWLVAPRSRDGWGSLCKLKSWVAAWQECHGYHTNVIKGSSYQYHVGLQLL